MKKILAAVMCLVLFVMTGAVAETVENEVSVIALNQSLELVFEAEEGEAKEDVQIVWASSDETVVAVDENGDATVLNAGEVVITATVTIPTIETVEKTVYEIVHEENAEGQLVARRVEKIVPEEVEKVITEEVELNFVVEPAQCPGCGAEYTNAAEYTAHVQIAACGAEGHYVCDGVDHETILDEYCANENPHRICQAGVATHECASCGNTYACENSGSHTTCIACGNAWCFKDNGNHTSPCGKRNHRACVVENYEKKDHVRCDFCGDLRCDGDRHGKGKCA